MNQQSLENMIEVSLGLHEAHPQDLIIIESFNAMQQMYKEMFGKYYRKPELKKEFPLVEWHENVYSGGLCIPADKTKVVRK